MQPPLLYTCSYNGRNKQEISVGFSIYGIEVTSTI